MEFAPLMISRPLAMAKANLANLYINTDRLNEAAAELESALSIFENCNSSSEREFITQIGSLYANYAILLINLNRIDEAEANYLKAYKLFRDTDSHPAYIIAYGRTCFNLGNFYSVYKSEQETARKYFDESIEIFSKHVKDIPQLNNYIAMALNGKAYSYVFSEEYDTALSYINKAIDCLPRDANLYDSKCEILFKANKIEEAKQTLQSLHEIIQDIDIRSLPSYNLIYGNQQQ